MGEDALADLVGEVERASDPERLLVVAKSPVEAGPEGLVERVLARVAERCVAHVVSQPDRFDEVLVQLNRAGDDARDRARLEGVRHAGAVVVALRVDKDLRLALQPAKRLGMDDPVAVALERRAQRARLLLARAATSLVRAHGERGEGALLLLADSSFESVRNPSGQLRHRPSLEDDRDSAAVRAPRGS